MSDRLPVLALDFDGVIHDRPRRAFEDAIIDGPMVAGAVWFIVDATLLFDVQIYSCRSATPQGIAAMRDWLLEYMEDEAADRGVEAFDKIGWPTTKPAAFVSLDDRGLTFTGTFPDPASLLGFRPWNRQPLATAPKIHWSR